MVVVMVAVFVVVIFNIGIASRLLAGSICIIYGFDCLTPFEMI